MSIKQVASHTPPVIPAKDAANPATRQAEHRQAAAAGSASGTRQAVELGVQAIVQKQASQPDEINAARVESIHSAISEGRFEIRPERIADAALETARALLTGRKAG